MLYITTDSFHLLANNLTEMWRWKIPLCGYIVGKNKKYVWEVVKVIFLKRHWKIWWCHWRNAITGWDSCWKSHPYRESSDWSLNIFPSLYILFLLDLFSGKNEFLLFDISILPNLADNFKWLNLKCCGYMAGDRSRLPAIQKFRYAVILLSRTKNPYGKL